MCNAEVVGARMAVGPGLRERRVDARMEGKNDMINFVVLLVQFALLQSVYQVNPRSAGLKTGGNGAYR